MLNLIMGARNGAKTSREENDFYATNPKALDLFISAFDEKLNQNDSVNGTRISHLGSHNTFYAPLHFAYRIYRKLRFLFRPFVSLL